MVSAEGNIEPPHPPLPEGEAWQPSKVVQDGGTTEKPLGLWQQKDLGTETTTSELHQTSNMIF
jgi:hypothetical protein